MTTNITNTANYKIEFTLSDQELFNKEIASAMTGTNKDPHNREIRKKYGYDPNTGLSYRRYYGSTKELYESLITGRTYCHLFNPETTRKDGSFGSSEKNDSNFAGSYVIGVDIDETSYNSVSEFVDQLTLKPTFYYTSYSNKMFDPETCECKGARFRLMYVVSEKISGSYYYRYCANCLDQIIERDTKEPIHDRCNIRCAQYYNGTNIYNSSLITQTGYNGTIYDLSDFGISDQGYLQYLMDYCEYKTRSTIRTSEINSEISRIKIKLGIQDDQEKPAESISEDSRATEESTISPQLIADMKNQSYDQFMRYNRWKYDYIYRSEQGEWINDCYQKVDDNYFSLYWNTSKVKDGQKRRKKLYQRICLRRVMNPDIDADSLLFNAYEDRYRFFEIDSVLDIDCLVRNVEAAMKLTVEEIEQQFSDNLKYLRSRSAKRGYIFKSGSTDNIGERNRIIKDINWSDLYEKYNQDLSLMENLKNLQDQGINISYRTLYRFCSEKGITVDQAKLSDDELKELINPELSYRKNANQIRELGYRVDDKRLKSLLKELR